MSTVSTTDRVKYRPDYRDHERMVKKKHREEIREELRKQKEKEETEERRKKGWIYLARVKGNRRLSSQEKEVLLFEELRYCTVMPEKEKGEKGAFCIVPEDGLFDVVGTFRVSQAAGESFIAPDFRLFADKNLLAEHKSDWLLKSIEKEHFSEEIEVKTTEFLKKGQHVTVEWSNECTVGKSEALLTFGQLRLQKL